jgi:hypothetical protein
VFDRERFSSKKPFALLVEKTGQKEEMRGWWRVEEVDIYHRLGLVELGSENLKVTNRDEVIRDETRWKIIGNDFGRKLEEELGSTDVTGLQAHQVEIYPK